jgi:WD40 repeat protein
MLDRSGATHWQVAHTATADPEVTWERVAVNAPARLVVSYSTAAEVRRLDDGAPVVALRGAGPIRAAAFDRAGTRLATGDVTGEVRVWSLPAGTPIATCAGHTGAVEQLAFSSDGSKLLSASDDGDVRICDPATGAALQRLQGHTSRVSQVELSPDGHTVSSSSTDGSARLWDARTGALIATLASHHGEVQAARFSPDGRYIATAAADGAIRIWDTAGIALASLEGHAGRVMAVAWEPDGHLISAGYDGSIRRWDIDRALLASSSQRHAAAITDLAISRDGQWSASGGADGTVIVWDLHAGTQRAAMRGAGSVTMLRFAPDSRELVAADQAGQASAWSVPDGRLIRRWGDRVTSVAYTPDGHAIATGGEDRIVRLWNRDGAEIAHIPVGITPSEFLFDPSGRWMAFRPGFPDPSTDTVVIDLAAARLATRLHGDRAGYATAMDATRIATADGAQIRIWELGTWRPLAALSAHTATCHNLMFLSDGRLVSTGDDPKLLLWSSGYALLASLPIAGVHAIYMDATADGSLLITDGTDGAARIWDTRTYRELLSLPSHRQRLERVGLTPDGQRLLTAGADGRVVTWDLRRPVRSQAEIDQLVRCRVPLRLDGDLVLPRELDLQDPSCR